MRWFVARTRTRTFRVVPDTTLTWDLFLKDFLLGLKDVEATELADLAGLSVMGRAASTSGSPAAITATIDGQVLRLSGSALAFGTLATAGLTDNAVTNAKIRDSAALSVIGRSVSTAGDPADIAAGTDGNVLRRSGAAIGFGTVATAGIADDAISNDKIRDSVALSVIGRSANSLGGPDDISAANDGEVLRRSGAALGFGTIATAGIANDAVTNAKLADMAQDTIKGRTSGAGTGDPVDLTAAQVATIVAAAVASALGIAGGKYTPTLTNVANLDASTAFEARWIRIGNNIFVTGLVQPDATTVGVLCQLGISLPVASNLGVSSDLAGVSAATAVQQAAGIVGDTANDRAVMQWIATDNTAQNMNFHFAYTVI